MVRIRNPSSAGGAQAGVSRRRAGLTLLEALIASGILLMTMLAMTGAIAAGQAAAMESERLVLASTLADDLLSEIAASDYDDLTSYHGLLQEPGECETVDGAPYPSTYWALGREVSVTNQTLAIGSRKVGGRLVRVTVYDERRDLVSAELFVPEPAS